MRGLRAWAQRTPRRERQARHPAASPVPEMQCRHSNRSDSRAKLVIAPGMSGAARAWAAFKQQLAAYGSQRDFPALQGPPGCSAHLRFGTASIRELVGHAERSQTRALLPGCRSSSGAILLRLLWHGRMSSTTASASNSTRSPGTTNRAFAGLVRGSHRLSAGRRRDAGARGAGARCTIGCAWSRPLSSPRTSASTGGEASDSSPRHCSTTTSPRTMAAGSGAPRRVATPQP